MKRIHTKYTIIEEAYNQYASLYKSFSTWKQGLENVDKNLNESNAGLHEEERHRRNYVYFIGDMTNVMDKIFHLQLTLSIVKELVKGLILCADDFISVLRDEEVYDLNTYNNCKASSTDVLKFEDAYCSEDSGYEGLIKTESLAICAQGQIVRNNLSDIETEIGKLQIMDISITGDMETINNCVDKQNRVYNLYSFLVVFAKGVKNLNEYFYDNLNSYITKAGARQHTRLYIYSGEDGEIEADLKQALLGLPFDVDMSNISYTDDGFVLVKESLAELLEKQYPGQNWDEYKDYYITGLNTNGVTSFSIIKAPVGSTVTVPFKVFDVGAIAKAMDGTSNPDEVRTAISKAVKATMENKDISSKDDALTDYYADPKSKGSYLIADLIVAKSLEKNKDSAEEGYYKLQHGYDEHESNCKAKLDELEKKGIYDRETNSIRFDPSAMSNEAYNAILMDTTGDPDTFAYAAENDFHADGLNWAESSLGYSEATSDPGNSALSQLLGDFAADHTMESDAGVGESMATWTYEWLFKDTDGGFQHGDQVEAHG